MWEELATMGKPIYDDLYANMATTSSESDAVWLKMTGDRDTDDHTDTLTYDYATLAKIAAPVTASTQLYDSGTTLHLMPYHE